ncbi:MAG: 50S ribosomal protein L15 [Candidatus Omnitrophica bacterium]|nr:50S ribosomal protein L15 [Candidatus Omnitrophota bacterium]
MVGLYNLKAPLGAHKKKKLLGRGPSSGHGKTSTRGSKGQTSRAGRHFYAGFEGGTSPLIRRMPKRGFTSKFKTEYQIVNLRDLNKIKDSNISLVLLEEKGLIKDKAKLVKVLGEGEIKAPITVQAHAFSRKASKEIINAGGKTEIVNV